MPLTRLVIPTAVTAAVLATLGTGAIVPLTPNAGAATAAQPVTWHQSAGSEMRWAGKGRSFDRAVAHRYRAGRPGTVQLRSSTAGPRRATFTVWLRTERRRTVRLQAVRISRQRTHVVTSRTVRVRPGTWRKFIVTARPKAGLRARLDVRVKGLRTAELVRVAGSSTTATAPRPPRTFGRKPAPTAGVLTNGCGHSARGLPSCGSYLGMAYGSNSDPAPLEAGLGTPLGVRRTYYTASQVSRAIDTARTDLAKGRLPWISFKFPHDWKAMSSGAGDAWARDLARRLATLDGPVWVAFHHEPEGDGNMALWRAAQERLGPIMRTASNVGFTVVLTGWHQFYGGREFSLGTVWPRTTVDVAGFDIYNSGGVVKNGKTLKATNMDAAYFAKIQAWADREGVAWGLAETGYTDAASATDPNWIARTSRQLTARGGVAMAYFNTTLNSIAPWHLSNATKKRDYRAAHAVSPRLPKN